CRRRQLRYALSGNGSVMNRLLQFSILGFAGFGFCAVASAEPRVITGIGPETMPVCRAPPAQAAVQSSNYGGGFLELLITGRDPTSRMATRPAPIARPMP